MRDAQWVSLGGLHTRAAMVEQPGRWTGVQLDPPPGGRAAPARRPGLRPPGRQLGRARPGRRPRSTGWSRSCTRRADWPGRYAAVSRVPAAAAPPARTRPPPARDRRPRSSEAWRLLTGPSPRAVAEVADAVGYSRRRLTQLLSGRDRATDPKTVQRLARFDTARREVVAATSGDGATLAEVAARTGYYDQSHLRARLPRVRRARAVGVAGGGVPKCPRRAGRRRGSIGAMSDPHRTTVWPALQAHDPDLVIRTLVALGFEETAVHRDEAGVVQHAAARPGPRAAGVMLGCPQARRPVHPAARHHVRRTSSPATSTRCCQRAVGRRPRARRRSWSRTTAAGSSACADAGGQPVVLRHVRRRAAARLTTSRARTGGAAAGSRRR